MANKMRVSKANLGGAMLANSVNMNSGVTTYIPKRVVEKNYEGEALGAVAEKLNYLDKKQREEQEKQQVMLADELLDNYRRGLLNAQSADEFDALDSSINQNLQTAFNQTDEGRDFWQKHGASIMEANASDSKKIREEKNLEFGRSKVQDILAQSQNRVARVDGKKASQLIDFGLDEIDKTPFLSDKDKNIYRYDYLKGGLLNMAINSPAEARKKANELYNERDKETLLSQIDEVEKYQIKAQKEAEDKAKDDYMMLRFKDGINIWQSFENGNLNEAQFYVLKKQKGQDVLYGDDSDTYRYPLLSMYKSLRQSNLGKKPKPMDVCQIGNDLISAYKGGKIDKNNVFWLQNKLFDNSSDDDTIVYNFADRLFGKDADDFDDDHSKVAMDEKARQFFLFYRQAEKKANDMVQEYIMAHNGQILAAEQEKIKSQVLKDVAKENGFEPSSLVDVCSFDELRKIMTDGYSGCETDEIWRQFYSKAPYSENKQGLMKQLAINMQRQSLLYPRFESVNEVKNAQLKIGDKFYLQGRLAVMKG